MFKSRHHASDPTTGLARHTNNTCGRQRRLSENDHLEKGELYGAMADESDLPSPVDRPGQTSYQSGHHYASAQSEPEPVSEPPSSMLVSVSDMTRDTFSTLSKDTLSWRPTYLRRTVIACFILVFALMLVAIEVLLVFSNKNYGLATPYGDLHYFWTYGPTAFLTLIGAGWGRVEFQSKLVALWIRLSCQQPALYGFT